MGRLASIHPSKFLVDTLPLEVIWSNDLCEHPIKGTVVNGQSFPFFTGLPVANPVLNHCSCLLRQKKYNCVTLSSTKSANCVNPSSARFIVNLCGVFGTPEAAARFRQTERYYCSILERLILQNLRVEAQSGFRVTIECYERSSEPTLLRVLTLSRNSRRQLPEYQNEVIA